jgi:hypothetical protein
VKKAALNMLKRDGFLASRSPKEKERKKEE